MKENMHPKKLDPKMKALYDQSIVATKTFTRAVYIMKQYLDTHKDEVDGMLNAMEEVVNFHLAVCRGNYKGNHTQLINKMLNFEGREGN